MPTLVLPLKEIKCGTPPRIHKAGIGLNRASALFANSLYESKTEYAHTCRLSEFFRPGKNLARRGNLPGAISIPVTHTRVVVHFAFNPKVKR